MKYYTHIIEPKTCQERDNVKALKLVLDTYEPVHYGGIFVCGFLLKKLPVSVVKSIQDCLNDVETDDYGRDANGIDIMGALRALNAVKPIKKGKRQCDMY